MTRSPCLIHRIQPDDIALMAGLMDVFGEAFEVVQSEARSQVQFVEERGEPQRAEAGSL